MIDPPRNGQPASNDLVQRIEGKISTEEYIRRVEKRIDQRTIEIDEAKLEAARRDPRMKAFHDLAKNYWAKVRERGHGG